MLLTYDVIKVPFQAIWEEHQIDQRTAWDWFQFYREVILDYIECNLEMSEVGGNSSKGSAIVHIIKNDGRFGGTCFDCVPGFLLQDDVSATADIIKKDRFKMAAEMFRLAEAGILSGRSIWLKDSWRPETLPNEYV